MSSEGVRWILTRRAPEGEIRSLAYQVENVAVIRYVSLWDRGHDGSLWFRLSAVINIPPGSGNINSTIQAPDGEVVPVTVSRSGPFLEMDDSWFNSEVRPIFCASPETFHKWSSRQY